MIEAPWAKIPISLTREEGITLSDIKVYVAIDYRAGKSGRWYGSQERIAQDTGISRRAVVDAVTALRERGYITTEKAGMFKRNVLLYGICVRIRAECPSKPTQSLGAPISSVENPSFEGAINGIRVITGKKQEAAVHTSQGSHANQSASVLCELERVGSNIETNIETITDRNAAQHGISPPPPQRIEALLQDRGFIERLRDRFAPHVDWEYELEKWRDHMEVRPPKGNYKNSLRNWLENAMTRYARAPVPFEPPDSVSQGRSAEELKASGLFFFPTGPGYDPIQEDDI